MAFGPPMNVDAVSDIACHPVLGVETYDPTDILEHRDIGCSLPRKVEQLRIGCLHTDGTSTVGYLATFYR